MAKDYAKSFYNSKAWQDCRAAFISKRIDLDGGLCQVCHRQLGYIVHHKRKITPGNITDRYITLNHSNLQYVCKRCHDDIHDGEFRKRKQTVCVFDEAGKPIPK